MEPICKNCRYWIQLGSSVRYGKCRTLVAKKGRLWAVYEESGELETWKRFGCPLFGELESGPFFLEPGILADTGYSQLYIQFPEQEDKFLIAILTLEVAPSVRDGLNKRWLAYLDYLGRHDLT